eukprot:Tamp_06977.p1 GENE.Tamp_06977~~Tamp_06977.p1  ORF type:complete len:693 (+),score=154.35 Tamp_06977:97-2175(+)
MHSGAGAGALRSCPRDGAARVSLGQSAARCVRDARAVTRPLSLSPVLTRCARCVGGCRCALARSRCVPACSAAVVYPIGMMMLGLAVLAVPFYLAKQTQLIAMIIVGGFVGVVEIDGQKLDERMGLSMPTAAALYELGILFLLFMAGMEVDLGAVMKGWKLILINGFGHIGMNFALFVGLASAAFKSDPEVSSIGIIYFALCCTLSSTIMVLGCLKKRGEMEGMHGQITLGIMVLQDIVAVFAIAIMDAFDRRPGAPEVNIGRKLGYLVMWFAILLIVLVLLERFVLKKLFHVFAVSAEMLFIVTFAYSLGMAALFGHFLPGWITPEGFNQELSIFFAGASIAALPYRVQIETFVEPIKAFGVVLFFFILGINLPLEPIGDLADALPWGFGIALLTVFVLPVIVWIAGAIAGVDSKVAFMISFIINQISEFSLILASGLNGYMIFSKNMYLTIVVATIVAFILSGCGHAVLDLLYEKFGKKVLWPLDKYCRNKEQHEEGFEMHHHVVLLGFNEIGMEIAEYFRKAQGEEVLCVQLDPELHSRFTQFYKFGAAKACKTGAGTDAGVCSNVYSQYADPSNPDTWHHYELHHAKLVVSCQQGTTESDCVLAEDLAKHNVPFLCLSDSNVEARVMYEAGVRYVIQSESLAAKAVKRQLAGQALTKQNFMAAYKQQHQADIKDEEEDPHRKLLAEFL